MATQESRNKDLVITIYNSAGEEVLNVIPSDDSYHYQEIMGRNDVTLYFSIAKYIEIPVGSYITWRGATYTLRSVDKMTMQHRRYYDYEITFESSAAILETIIFYNTVTYTTSSGGSYIDGRVKFSLTTTPLEHLQLICACLNVKTGDNWQAEGDNTKEICLSYDCNTCMEALQMVADALETEWYIDGTTIYLGKVLFDDETNIAISYGQGNGLRAGVSKQIDSSELPIGTLYTQGGDRNIVRSSYGSDTLCLPKDVTAWYNGEEMLIQKKQPGDDYREFKTNESGRAVYLNEDDAPTAEAAIALDEIYPSQTYKITQVECEDEEKHYYNVYVVIDGTEDVPEDNFNDYLTDEAMTAVFQDGMLAGKEFEVNWIDKTETDEESGEEKRVCYFEIVPSTIDYIDMPDADTGYLPVSGDTFRLFNLLLPESYIESAEEQLLLEGIKYLWEHLDTKFTLEGEIDPIWSRERWSTIGSRLKIGYCFSFTDPKWQSSAVSIRITNVKTYLNRPYSPIVELSNETIGGTVASAIRTAEAAAVNLPSVVKKEAANYTRRRFRDALDTMDAISAYFTDYADAIKPSAVQTMQMLVGDERLQFELYQDEAMTSPYSTAPISLDSDSKLNCSACWLKHFDIDDTGRQISTISGDHSYMWWAINEVSGIEDLAEDSDSQFYVYITVPYVVSDDSSTALDDHTGGYWRVKKVGADDAVLDLIQSAEDGGVLYDGTSGDVWNFLVGVYSKVLDGERSFAPLYGFTEILPGRITTDLIADSNNYSWLNLKTGQFSWGDGKLTFDAETGQLVLRGTMIQTGSTALTYISRYCGTYDKTRVYSAGDVVYYSGSSYIYINESPISGKTPTNTTYWAKYASKGADGADGTDGAAGADGADGQGVMTSFIFGWVAYGYTPLAPTAGTESWDSPIPSDPNIYITSGSTTKDTGLDWSDGITNEGEGIRALWMSQRKFTSNGESPQESSWSTPVLMQDSDTIDYEFSSVETSPGNPTENPDNWHNDATENDVWMAVRRKEAGEDWGDWTIVKIKGEDGSTYKMTSSEAVGYYWALDDDESAVPSADEDDGWSEELPSSLGGFYLWTRYKNTWVNEDDESDTYTSYMRSAPVFNGANGSDGASFATPYRGNYNSEEAYYGTSYRCDIVLYNEVYYMARMTAGEGFQDKTPGVDTDYWMPFGSSYSNIATGFIFSNKGQIQDLKVNALNTEVYDDDGKVLKQHISAEGNTMSMFDSDGVQKLVITADDLSAIGTESFTKTMTRTATPISSRTLSTSGTTSYTGYMASSLTLTLEAGANVTLPEILTTSTVRNNTSTYGTITVKVYWLVDDTYMYGFTTGSVNYEEGDATSTKKTLSLTLPSVEINGLSAGSHTFRPVVVASIGAVDSFSCSILVSNGTSTITVSVAYSAEQVQIGSNGLRVIFGDTDYMFQAIRDTETTDTPVEILARVGNYAIKITESGGIQYTTDGWSTTKSLT